MFPVCTIPYQSAAAGKQNAKASIALLSLFSLGYFVENLICNVIQAWREKVEVRVQKWNV
jgi:hypothetical protein